ncbi:hypothetical protein GUITHDRAFT_120849 [Guillardia theta CCMP2712]|uniref:Uncharacterized protein n=1 Tax=Guillardia theta (strain CCMP2712) TaxID=905079 RepID=L1I9P0_GUITC|nr:hypothetical protein GUITHDRAFT_120849 [Guillardia theta CCMP2712]EKX32971.1 hypothetical protein GUITHDRAFT_120849 [Guillardia theta CCMP2712]|eukprot:XP_005819951.1 hypothetical protein GUITHDRAFT_120849 [Guillardia theta CCMP2712]
MAEEGKRRERTTTELELEVERLEATNLNLKLRVSQLEEALEEAALSEPSSLSATPVKSKVARLPEDGDRLRAIESEWLKVQKLHEEVFQLRAELELGKLPSEERNGALEGELHVARSNAKEMQRQKEEAEEKLRRSQELNKRAEETIRVQARELEDLSRQVQSSHDSTADRALLLDRIGKLEEALRNKLEKRKKKVKLWKTRAANIERHAFTSKVVLRLEAEAKTLRQRIEELQAQSQEYKREMDMLTICNPGNSLSFSFLPPPDQTQGDEAEQEDRKKRSSRRKRSARDDSLQLVETLATRMAQVLTREEERATEKLEQGHEEEERMRVVAELQLKVSELESFLARKEDVLRATTDELSLCKSKLARARQHNVANKGSLKLWEDMLNRGQEEPVDKPRAPQVSRVRMGAEREEIDLRKRVGQLELECAKYLELLSQQGRLVEIEGEETGRRHVDLLLLESRMHRRDHLLQAIDHNMRELLHSIARRGEKLPAGLLGDVKEEEQEEDSFERLEARLEETCAYLSLVPSDCRKSSSCGRRPCPR